MFLPGWGGNPLQRRQLQEREVDGGDDLAGGARRCFIISVIDVIIMIIIVFSSGSSSSTRNGVWIRPVSNHKNVTACRRDDWTYIKPCKNPHKLAKHCWRGECWSWWLDPAKSIPNTRTQMRSVFFSDFWDFWDLKGTHGFGFFCFLVFPMVFRKPKKPSGKPKILKKTKENQQNQTNLRENQKEKVFKGFRPTLGYGFVLFCFVGFPEGF